jgi:hypothetical protein
MNRLRGRPCGATLSRLQHFLYSQLSARRSRKRHGLFENKKISCFVEPVTAYRCRTLLAQNYLFECVPAGVRQRAYARTSSLRVISAMSAGDEIYSSVSKKILICFEQ